MKRLLFQNAWGRLLLVLAPLAIWHLLSRVLWNAAVTTDTMFTCPSQFEVRTFDVSIPQYLSQFSQGPCVTKSIWTYMPVDWTETFMSHVLGLIVFGLAAAIALVLTGVVSWIIDGPSDYVDPCQDPDCPCARHKVERDEEAAAKTALLAATTAAVTTTVINNN